MRKIVLLVCDQFPGILTPDIPSYEWMFERVFTQADDTCRFKVYQTWLGELPSPDIEEDAIYLITGSNNSAYDNVAWVVKLRYWIKQAYTRGCLLAGICFGHQVIAEALGGKVQRSPKGWGIGLRSSQIVDSVFKDIAGSVSFTVLYDHHDQVVKLPQDAVLVSRSDFCPLESFRIGRQVLTLQGHPEFTNAFISHWIKDCAPDEPLSIKENALASMASMENQGVKVAGWIMQFFNK